MIRKLLNKLFRKKLTYCRHCNDPITSLRCDCLEREQFDHLDSLPEENYDDYEDYGSFDHWDDMDEEEDYDHWE